MGTANRDHHIHVPMGVSGSGESTVASGVAHQLQAAFLDDDFLHPHSDIMEMASSEPLNDDDRKPQLQALNDAASVVQRINKVPLIVRSILKKVYHNQLHDDDPNPSSIYLKEDFNVVGSCLKTHKDHFFRTQMLVTQFETLEEPGTGENGVLVVDIDQPLDGVAANTIEVINQDSKQ